MSLGPDEKYDKDDEGNPVPAPILPEHENRVASAAASGRDDLVGLAQEEYDDARVDHAEEHNKRADKLESNRQGSQGQPQGKSDPKQGGK
jgi:hypothetical protein